MSVGKIDKMEAAYVVIGKAAIAGTIGAVAGAYILGGSMSESVAVPIFGTLPFPLAIGVAIGSSQALASGIFMAIPDTKKPYWASFVYGALEPALAAGAAVGVTAYMFPGSDMSAYGMLAGIAAGSSMAGDYVINKTVVPWAMSR